MIRKLIAALVFAALLPICAQAQSFTTWAGQNYVSPTPPAGDSSDRNATTSFVNGSFSSVSGDCTVAYVANIPTFTCTKTNGVAFGYFATGTDAANLTGNLSINRFNGGSGASSLTFWRGDGTWAAQRTQLSGTTTFYVNYNNASANCNGSTCGAGSDTTGDGSLAKPWKTRAHAYAQLQANYDLNGQTVTIQLADGTIPDSLQVYAGTILGQGGPSGLVFQGNCTSPRNVLVQPAANTGYAYGFFYGSAATIKCQEMDQTNQGSIFPGGADTVSVGQSSKVIFDTNLWFGCNFQGFNAITVSFGGYGQANADFTNDVGRCQQTPTATYSIGGSTMTVSSATGLYPGMGITNATGFPLDVYISSIVGTTVTVTCRHTTPCTSSANETNLPIIASGGGQFFLNLGNDASFYFNTNGQSDYGIVDTLGNYPFYLNYFYINDHSSPNMQGISFVNVGQARGGCFVGTGLSVLDSGLQGVPYLPCRSQAVPTTTATLTSGSQSFTVASTANMAVGQAINGYAQPTGTWTQGGSTIALSSATGVCIGARIQGEGLLTGAAAIVSNLVGTTVTLAACGSGPRCVTNYPTYQAKTNQQLYITGCGVPNGSVITGINGTTVTVNKAATASGSQSVAFEGDNQDFSVYK